MANKILKQSELFRQNPWEYIKIHQIMLQDKQRTMCYKKAIENNLKRNAIVIDLGCGTGILSFFAATKGCRKIYASEAGFWPR
jgi:protein arginine N-methyltransferase 1